MRHRIKEQLYLTDFKSHFCLDGVYTCLKVRFSAIEIHLIVDYFEETSCKMLYCAFLLKNTRIIATIKQDSCQPHYSEK